MLELPVLLGCAPNLRVVFDWKASKKSLYEHEIKEVPFDCLDPDPNMPCFYFGNGNHNSRDVIKYSTNMFKREQLFLGFYPYFLIIDGATGTTERFKGNFVLRVIGGGTTVKNLRRFTDSEIYHYNNWNRSQLYLTTTALALQLHNGLVQNVTHNIFVFSENRARVMAAISSVGYYNGYSIYRHHRNGIS